MKAIVHFHFGRIPELKHKNNWEWNILKKVITSADKIIVLDKNSYTTLLASNFSNVEIVPNPVAPEIINQIDNIIDIKRMPGTILFVGHVVKTKGIFELIEACKTISNIKVKLIGHISDSMKSAIKSVAGYNNEQWLDIMGELSYKEVIVEMCKCDIFVLPTYTEGFPNVILESMASGCAIITTKVGAIPEMLEIDEKGKYCTFVDVGNIEQLKTAITNLLYNEKIKIELRKNVYRRVRERYSMPIIWEMLENIWRNLNN